MTQLENIRQNKSIWAKTKATIADRRENNKSRAKCYTIFYFFTIHESFVTCSSCLSRDYFVSPGFIFSVGFAIFMAFQNLYFREMPQAMLIRNLRFRSKGAELELRMCETHYKEALSKRLYKISASFRMTPFILSSSN